MPSRHRVPERREVRPKKRMLVALLALAVASGCGATPFGTEDAMHDIELAAAEVDHLRGTPEDAASAGEAINAFGLALYGRVVAGNPGANAVISPASVAIALSMARAGARGRTAAEIDAVLRDLGTDEHAAWLAALDTALNSRTGSFPDLMGGDQDVTLRIVNAPFAQRGLALEQAYLDALAARFGAGLRLVDYRTAADAARALINEWVAGQTEERVDELLGQGTLNELASLVLVNAIYLKAAWQTPFAGAATAPAAFSRLDGSTVTTPVMHAALDVPYAAGDGWQAVELRYVGGKLAFVVIVPNDLPAFEATLGDAALAAVTGGLAPQHVILALPKFETETRVELAAVLSALGMPTAFTRDADFTGITTEEPLLIDAVIHQANIDVDENGTEAAAAAAVVMRPASMPVASVTVTVDRPFLFALRDVETGSVLFLGRVTDPSLR